MLAIFAVLIIMCLACYATYLVLQVRRQKKQREKAAHDWSLKRQESANNARENISIMLRVLEQKQVSLTEAAIRIMSLSLALPESEREGVGYQAFDQLAKATAHIPILTSWKSLSSAEQADFNREREVIENTHRSAIAEAVLSLQGSMQPPAK